MSGPVGVPEPGIGIIDELATALMDQWAESEPEHSITKNPVSYVATFVELARAAHMLVAPRVRAEREAEIAGLIRKNAATLDSFAREGSTAGLIAYLIDNVMATGEAVPAAITERHDAGCEQARGWGPCFCQRRADVDFSHTATGPLTTPLCEHGCTRAHRRRINPGEFLDCPGPVATPTGPGRQLRVMEAHRLEDCADPATCWYEPHRSGRRVPVDQGLPFAAPDMYAGDPLDDLPRPTATPGGQP